MNRRVLIYGAGGFAREVAWLAESCNSEHNAWEPVGFIDDSPHAHGAILNGLPVLDLEEAVRSFPDAFVVAGIGTPRTREAVLAKAVAAGLHPGTLIHPRVEMSPFVEIGQGSVICAGNILTTNIRIGRNVQINLDCTIGHDCILEDHSTLAPGVHVSGWVHIGRRAYLGTGAAVINGTSRRPLEIGEDAVIGAGACVTKSVLPGLTMVGVPARALARPAASAALAS